MRNNNPGSRRQKKILLIMAIRLALVCMMLAGSIMLSGCDGRSWQNVWILRGCVQSISDADETAADTSGRADAIQPLDVSAVEIPAYSGAPNVLINDGIPFFSEEEIITEFGISLAETDSLKRCGSCRMCADEEHIQTGERESISDIHPTGWHSNSIYQRSHLLMWKLCGSDDERNLITGTETFNQEGMLEYEERVTAYLWRHKGSHVIYRVTPLFEGSDLVARGVLMEAMSAEDGGKGLSFCIFIYNVEPGYDIDYSTGDYTHTEG